MKEEKVDLIHTYMSEAELLSAYDIASESIKCVALSWIQSNNDSKILWIIKENILSLEDDGMELLIHIYSQVFGFDDDWTEENV